MSRKCTIWVVVISLYLTNVQSTCLEHDAEVLLLCCKSHFKSRHRHGTRPLMLFISPCSFIHPFNVFSQTLCWRSQCAQSVYIPDIPRCLHAVFISTSFAVHRIMLHSETVCSFRNGYIARLHIQHFHSHTPVLGGVLHRSLGKFWLVNVKIILKVMLGCRYLKCLSIWTSGCSLWRMWWTYWLRGRRQLFGGPTDCVEEGNYLVDLLTAWKKAIIWWTYWLRGRRQLFENVNKQRLKLYYYVYCHSLQKCLNCACVCMRVGVCVCVSSEQLWS
jgi:hypothetical protein